MKTLPHLSFVSLLACASAVDAVEIYGHRGAAGLAPENTIKGIATALRIGVDAIDMDVGLTRDGVVVLSHDPYLNPDFTRDKQGQWLQHRIALSSLKAVELKHFLLGRLRPHSQYAAKFPYQQTSADEKMPTLAEAMKYIQQYAPDSVKLQIEIKTNPLRQHEFPAAHHIATALHKTLRQHPLSNPIEVHAFEWDSLVLLKTLNTPIAYSYLTGDTDINNPEVLSLWQAGKQLSNYVHGYPELIQSMGGQIWCPRLSEITADQIKLAHHYGLKVNVWTVDDATDMARLIDWQVDGIITNRPDILRGVMAAKGLPLPKAQS